MIINLLRNTRQLHVYIDLVLKVLTLQSMNGEVNKNIMVMIGYKEIDSCICTWDKNGVMSYAPKWDTKKNALDDCSLNNSNKTLQK